MWLYIFVLISMSCFFQIFINNEYVNSVSGKTFPTTNPSNGQKIADIQEGDKVSSLPNLLYHTAPELYHFYLTTCLNPLCAGSVS